MTLWPTLITGIVGVAGIAGTILAARMAARSQTANLILSINEDRERVRLADKRQVYANFIASVHGIILEAVALRYSVAPEERLKAALKALPAQGVIFNRLSELELIAPEGVVSHANTLADFIVKFVYEMLENVNAVDLERLRSVDAQVDQMEKQLYKIMRGDIDMTPINGL